MKKTQSNIFPKRTEYNTGGKNSLKTTLQVISTSILILSLGMAVFLPFRESAVDTAQAAPLPGVPIDQVTWIKTTNTSNFQTANDPIDDSIEYEHTAADTVSDSFEYEICDGATIPVCVIGTVNITVSTATLAATVESPQALSADVINVAISAGTDDATVVQYSWVNIDVLANDVWGDDGPGTGPIRLGVDCVNGSDAGDCSTPSKGVASVNTGPRSPDPMGLAYLDGHPTPAYTDKLLISDSEVNEIFPPNPAAYAGVNLFITNLAGKLTQTLDGDGKYYRLTTIIDPPEAYTDEPTGVAYNPSNDHLFFTDDNHNKIIEVDPETDGLYGTSDDIIMNDTSETEFKTDRTAIGSASPSGIAFAPHIPFDDPESPAHLFFVDDDLEMVYDINLDTNGTLDQDDSVTSFETTSIGITKPEGVEFNPDNGHLYIASSHWTNLIAETTIDGTLLRYLDLSSVPDLSNISGLAYIPQANGAVTSTLYVVDRNVDNNPLSGSPVRLGDPSENDGKMFEVTLPNAAPYVDAGLDQTIVYPNMADLNGVVIDDGLPDPPGGFTNTWSAESKPLGSTVTFGDENALITTASFSNNGVYTLRLTAWDEDRPTTIPGDPYDEVIITVNQSPPLVNAGPDQIVVLPDDANLVGTVVDDGMPDPPGEVDTTWSVESKPLGSTVTFGDEKALLTTASLSKEGAYVLRLTADDGGGLPINDEVTITVSAVPIQNIWLPLILKSTTNP